MDPLAMNAPPMPRRQRPGSLGIVSASGLTILLVFNFIRVFTSGAWGWLPLYLVIALASAMLFIVVVRLVTQQSTLAMIEAIRAERGLDVVVWVIRKNPSLVDGGPEADESAERLRGRICANAAVTLDHSGMALWDCKRGATLVLEIPWSSVTAMEVGVQKGAYIVARAIIVSTQTLKLSLPLVESASHGGWPIVHRDGIELFLAQATALRSGSPAPEARVP